MKFIGVGDIVVTIVVMIGIPTFAQGHFRYPLFRNSTNLQYLWRGLTAKRTTIKGFFSPKTDKHFWVNILIMVVTVVLIVFSVMKWLDVYTRHGGAVVVSDVKGVTVDEASEMFRNHGLVCVASNSNYVKSMIAGIVLDVNSGIGQKVKEDRIIYLTINTLSIPLRVVPDVANNSSLRQAQAKMLAAEFKLTEIQLIDGEKDWVYGIKYRGRSLNVGNKVPLGVALTLMAGNGEDEPLESNSMESVEGVDEPISSESPSSRNDSWL